MRSRWLLVVSVLVACSHKAADVPDHPRIEEPPKIPDPPSDDAPAALADAPGYVGPQVCGECHKEKLEGASKTSHFHTSSLVSAENAGLPAGADVLVPTTDPSLRIHAIQDQDHGGYFQVAIDAARKEHFSRPMQIAIGSGKLAHTYFFWERDRLYELPATFFTGIGWRSSPGYRHDRAQFDRPVFCQCMECHSLWADCSVSTGKYDNRYRGEPLLGFSCEKCHGPGADHVAFHRANPDSEEAHAIVSPLDLTRERRDDICLFCHAERGEPQAAPFSWRPGEEVRKFYAAPAPKPVGAGESPLHSFNQFDRLSQSKCYAGGKLSCISCHNPHRFERGDDKTFSERCQKCHAIDSLTSHDQDYHSGKVGCIDCHMQKRTTEIEIAEGSSEEERVEMRDHLIALPPKAAKDGAK